MSMLKMRKDALVSLRDGLWIYAPSIDVFWPSMPKHMRLDRSVYCIILREEEREGRKKRTNVKSRGELGYLDILYLTN